MKVAVPVLIQLIAINKLARQSPVETYQQIHLKDNLKLCNIIAALSGLPVKPRKNLSQPCFEEILLQRLKTFLKEITSLKVKTVIDLQVSGPKVTAYVVTLRDTMQATVSCIDSHAQSHVGSVDIYSANHLNVIFIIWMAVKKCQKTSMQCK